MSTTTKPRGKRYRDELAMAQSCADYFGKPCHVVWHPVEHRYSIILPTHLRTWDNPPLLATFYPKATA